MGIKRWALTLIRGYDATPEEPYMQVRRLATQLWTDAGHRGGIHGFMVSYPPTREAYENKARKRLGIA